MKKSLTVQGVLETSAGGNRLPRATYLVLDLLSWTRSDGVTAEVPLVVEIPVPDADLTRHMRKLDEGMSVRVALTSMAPRPAKDFWLARGKLPVERIRAIRVASRPAAKAPVLRDATLGRLVLDPSLGAYTGRARLFGKRVELLVSVPASGNTERAVALAAALVKRLPGLEAAAGKALGKKLLPLYEKKWRGDGPALTAAKLLARLKPASVVCHADGTGTLVFSAGGLFGDHGVEVRLKKTGAFSQIGLA